MKDLRQSRIAANRPYNIVWYLLALVGLFLGAILLLWAAGRYTRPAASDCVVFNGSIFGVALPDSVTRCSYIFNSAWAATCVKSGTYYYCPAAFRAGGLLSFDQSIRLASPNPVDKCRVGIGPGCVISLKRMDFGITVAFLLLCTAAFLRLIRNLIIWSKLCVAKYVVKK